MKFSVVSILTVAFLTMGPAGAIPIDGIQDQTTADGASRTDDAMPTGSSAIMTSDNSDQVYTPAHDQGKTEYANSTTADAISRTNDAMPPGASETLTSDKLDHDCTCHQGVEDAGVATTNVTSHTGDTMPIGADKTLTSHNLDHDCTDAHAHQGVEDTGAATTDATSQTDIAIPAIPKAPLNSHNVDDNSTDAHTHHGVIDTGAATATTAPNSDEQMKASVKRAPPQRGTPDSMEAQRASAAEISSSSQGTSPSQSGDAEGDNGQDALWIPGTCTSDNICHFTVPGETEEREVSCPKGFPCVYPGFCVGRVHPREEADCR